MFVFFPVIYRVCFRRAWQSPRAEGPSFALRIMVLGASLACLRLTFRHTERASSPRTTHTLHDKNAKFGQCFRLKPVQKTNFLPIGNTLI